MSRGKHPNSLQNLTHVGRPLDYGEAKKIRRLSVTETGWDNARKLIEKMGISVSEFIELLGRGEVMVIGPSRIEFFQDVIDSAFLRQAITESNDEFIPVDEFLAGQGLSQADLHE